MHIYLGQNKYLTTHHIESECGIPVLVFNGKAYKRDDILPDGSKAGVLVTEWLKKVNKKVHGGALFLYGVVKKTE